MAAGTTHHILLLWNRAEKKMKERFVLGVLLPRGAAGGAGRRLAIMLVSMANEISKRVILSGLPEIQCCHF